MPQAGPRNAAQATNKNKYQTSAVIRNDSNYNVLNVKHINGEVHGSNISKKRNYESVFGNNTNCSKTQSSESSYVDSIPSTSKTQTYETLYSNSTPSCSKTQSSETSHVNSTQNTKKNRTCEELIADISAILNKNNSGINQVIIA